MPTVSILEALKPNVVHWRLHLDPVRYCWAPLFHVVYLWVGDALLYAFLSLQRPTMIPFAVHRSTDGSTQRRHSLHLWLSVGGQEVQVRSDPRSMNFSNAYTSYAGGIAV
jgi:hypothetical protein